jgi:hypothetical protein
MADVQSLTTMLQSKNPNKRYDACEALRVLPWLPPDAIVALRTAINDIDIDVADAAKRALEIHILDSSQNVANTTNQNESSNSITKHEFAVGFFGWFLLSNLVLWVFVIVAIVASSFINNYGMDIFFLGLVCIWLSTIIVSIVMFVKKRFWRGIGIVVAVILNMGAGLLLWQITKNPVATWTWETILIPMPSSFLLLIFALGIN